MWCGGCPLQWVVEDQGHRHPFFKGRDSTPCVTRQGWSDANPELSRYTPAVPWSSLANESLSLGNGSSEFLHQLPGLRRNGLVTSWYCPGLACSAS